MLLHREGEGDSHWERDIPGKVEELASFSNDFGNAMTNPSKKLIGVSVLKVFRDWPRLFERLPNR